MLTAKDFLTSEIHNEWKRDFDNLMSFRKNVGRRPDMYQRAQLELNGLWIDFYRTVLFHVEGTDHCQCKKCTERRAAMARTGLYIAL